MQVLFIRDIVPNVPWGQDRYFFVKEIWSCHNRPFFLNGYNNKTRCLLYKRALANASHEACKHERHKFMLKFLILKIRLLFSFVVVSHSVISDSLQPHGLQHTRLPCSSLTPRVCSNSCPLSWWCHPIISSSVAPFTTCLQSFPASGFFPMS